MCGKPFKDSAETSARNLARLFIRAYWSRVSAYAHTIHNEGNEPAANEDIKDLRMKAILAKDADGNPPGSKRAVGSWIL